jgi:hypothetical protein
MATRITRIFDRNQVKDYAIIDYDKFKKQTEVRMLALAAAAMVVWMDHAKSTFSASTSARYLESLYWEASSTNRITMGVVEGTLASLLEYGQDPRDLRSIFLKSGVKLDKKGRPYRKIPMDSDRAAEYPTPSAPFLASVESVRAAVLKRDPQVAEYIIRSQMARFDRANVKTTTYRSHGRFIPNRNQKFRTISRQTIDKPGDTWKHPGIRAALIGNQVSSWMDLNRSTFTSDMFQGEPGILL